MNSMFSRMIVTVGFLFFFSNCKEKKEESNYDKLTQEDVKSLEESSLYTHELIQYKGQFEGDYFGDKITLQLDKSGDYTINYKGNEIEGKWFKKDDGSFIEFDSKKQLPFQFMKWSDNTTLMILNLDGTSDDEGGNYLTRIE